MARFEERRLFAIREEIEAILAHEVNPETHEIGDEAVAALDRLEIAKEEKALEVAAYLKGERAEADKIRAVIEELADRAQVHLGRADRLERFVASCLEPGRNLTDPRVEIRWTKSVALEVEDEAAIPSDYFVQPPAPAPRLDKMAVRRALAAGEKVPGCELVRTHSMRVR
jgi:hypothetical protein